MGEDAILERRRLLRELPPCGDLPLGEAGVLPGIFPNGKGEDRLPAHLRSWLADLRTEIDKARGASDDLLARASRLAQMSEDLASAMDMRFLYDADRRLFAIGYQVCAGELFGSLRFTRKKRG